MGHGTPPIARSPEENMTHWYFADGEESVGPMSLAELQATLATLRNPGQVLVWCEDFPRWMRAREVPELRKQTVKPPPIHKRRPALPTEGPSESAHIDSRKTYTDHDDETPGVQENTTAVEQPSGIAGWLIFPATGTFVAPLYAIYGTVAGFGTLSTVVARNLSPGFTIFAGWEALFNLALVVAWLVAVFRLVRHKASYPRLYVILSAVTLVGSSIDLFVADRFFNIPFEPNDVKSILQPVVSLVVWGPYMFKSKRVRNTFINGKDASERIGFDWVAPAGFAVLVLLYEIGQYARIASGN
jgi:Protein of unknown function (DUF2569)/GYF domain 2